MSRFALPLAFLLLLGPLAGGHVAYGLSLDADEAALVAQINSFRAGRGLGTLTVSSTITTAAKWMATDMAVNNYFSHTSLDGRSPFQRMADAGYPISRTSAGENIAAGYATPAATLQGWIDSPGHFAILIDPGFRAIGVGRAYNAASRYGTYWVADFGGLVDSVIATPAPPAPLPLPLPTPPAPQPTVAPAPAPGTCQPSVGPGIAAPSAVPSGIDGFHAAWYGQSGYPTLCPGQTATAVVAYYNSGSKGWVAGRMGQVAYLGTWNPDPGQDRPSVLGGDGRAGSPNTGWPRYNRIAAQPASYVGPGQVAWFSFTIVAPSMPGTYRLSIRPLVEGAQWMEDYGVFWYVTVR
jgi:hypothetical protein